MAKDDVYMWHFPIFLNRQNYQCLLSINIVRDSIFPLFVCRKHYREYLVSLINGHSIDPATLFNHDELMVACKRYHLDIAQGEGEDDRVLDTRLLKVCKS